MSRQTLLAIVSLLAISLVSSMVLTPVAGQLVESVIPCSPIVESLDIQSVTPVADNIFDNDLQTASTVSSLTIKLIEPKILCSVDIAFVESWQTEHSFKVYVSSTGTDYTLAHDGLTTGPAELQHFIFNHKYFDMRYLKVDFDTSTTIAELYIDYPNPDRFRPPDPEPTPDTGIQLDNLRGANFIDPVLRRYENWSPATTTADFHVDKYMPLLKNLHLNLVRVPVYWESYQDSPAVFLDELELVVKTAHDNGIYVWIDNHHFYTTSYWQTNACTACGDYSKLGNGFPKYVVSGYHPTTSYESDPEVVSFWSDYYDNDVRGVANVWQKQADFMKAMAQRIDKYDNVIGYELLNEPHLFSSDQYKKLGDMQTFLAKELREVTDKAIIFTRETGHHGFLRQPAMEYLVIPRVDGQLIYSPHVYNMENVDFHIAKWKEYQSQWKGLGYDVDLGVGEWAFQPPQTPESSQLLSDEVIQKFKDNGMFWTYWGYAGFSLGEGNVIVNRDGTLTEEGTYIVKSVGKYYN